MLARVSVLHLTTRHGDLDLSFEPSGTAGYDNLHRGAVALKLRGLVLSVASLADIIRSKEAADREKDRMVLPALRRLLDQAGK